MSSTDRTSDVVVLSSDDEESKENHIHNSEDVVIVDKTDEPKTISNQILHTLLLTNVLPSTSQKNERATVISGNSLSVVDLKNGESSLGGPKKKIKLNPLRVDEASTSNCIVLSDDEQTVDSNELARDQIDKENLLNITKVENNVLGDSEIYMANKSPLQNNSYNQSILECRDVFNKFISLCLEKVEEQHKEALEEKIEIIKRIYDKVEHKKNNKDIKELKNVIQEKNCHINDNSALLLSIFKDLYIHLKSLYKENDIDKEVRRKIKKLNKTLILIRAKIKSLEEKEVDFDEEENSAYMQVQRYRDRATKIYNKICHLENRDPNEGRVTHARLNLQVSQYSHFNKALNKKFKNNDNFPTYYEVHKYLKKVAKQYKIDISEYDLDCEAKTCFEALGKKMKKRRQKELYEIAEGLIDKFESDPIESHEECLKKIRKHKEEADDKLEKLFRMYTIKQESGDDPKLSSDSDDSGEGEDDKSDDETVCT